MALNILIVESGSNVIVSGTGTANISALTSVGTASYSQEINPSEATVVFGQVAGSFTLEKYTGFTGPSDFGAGTLASADSSAFGGNNFGIDGFNGFLLLPTSYTGATLNNVLTFLGETLSSLGITPGTYLYEWGVGGTADSLTINAIGSATPTPTPSGTASVTPTPTGTASVTPTPTPTPAGYWIITNCFGNSFVVDISGSPSIGDVVLLTFTGLTPYGCYIVLDYSIGPNTDTATIVNTFTSCEECGMSYTGTTVDKFYEYNGFCCDPVSGYTGSGTVYPHPEYATNGGVAIQSMSVALGGLNGLNN